MSDGDNALLARVIKISKLSSSVTKEKLTEYFTMAGTIDSIELGSDEALIFFSTEESAENSLMLDKTMLGGSPISVEKATTLKLSKPEVIQEEVQEIIKQVPKERKEIPKEENPKEIPEENKKDEEKIEKKCQEDVKKMSNLLNYSNVPARCALGGDDLFAAVFNRKYGITIVGLWSIYIFFFNLLHGSI